MVLKRSIPNLNLELLGFFLDHFFQTEDRSFLVVERGSLGPGDCRDEQSPRMGATRKRRPASASCAC